MSITRDALRIAIVRALRGRTWAGDLVKDSQIVPIEDCAPDNPSPYLVVYTDDSRPGNDMRHTPLSLGQQTVLIDIAVTARMERVAARDASGAPLVDADGNPVFESMWLDTITDPQMELVLGAIERQVRVALAHPQSEWADIALSFGTIARIESVRGPSQRDGLRFVGRQLQITFELMLDPPAGIDPSSHAVWSRFLSAMEASGEPNAAQVAEHFRKLIRCDGMGWSPVDSARNSTAVSLADARALLMGPRA